MGWLVYVDSLNGQLYKIVFIECFIEDEAFSPSYDDLAPLHPLPPSPISKVSPFLNLPVCRRSSLLTGAERGGGGGGGAKARKPGPL
jgi:hypothetical protein